MVDPAAAQAQVLVAALVIRHLLHHHKGIMVGLREVVGINLVAVVVRLKMDKMAALLVLKDQEMVGMEPLQLSRVHPLPMRVVVVVVALMMKLYRQELVALAAVGTVD
jgi:hypothetical protein